MTKAQQMLLISDDRNQLHCGDCLSVLDTIPDESIDLIYIDPPFYSQRSYETIWEESGSIGPRLVVGRNCAFSEMS